MALFSRTEIISLGLSSMDGKIWLIGWLKTVTALFLSILGPWCIGINFLFPDISLKLSDACGKSVTVVSSCGSHCIWS